jgi:hypothetical protein
VRRGVRLSPRQRERHRASLHADQAMRVAGQGGTEATNPYFHIRTRYQELYRCGCVAGHVLWPRKRRSITGEGVAG